MPKTDFSNVDDVLINGEPIINPHINPYWKYFHHRLDNGSVYYTLHRAYDFGEAILSV